MAAAIVRIFIVFLLSPPEGAAKWSGLTSCSLQHYNRARGKVPQMSPAAEKALEEHSSRAAGTTIKAEDADFDPCLRSPPVQCPRETPVPARDRRNVRRTARRGPRRPPGHPGRVGRVGRGAGAPPRSTEPHPGARAPGAPRPPRRKGTPPPAMLFPVTHDEGKALIGLAWEVLSRLPSNTSRSSRTTCGPHGARMMLVGEHIGRARSKRQRGRDESRPHIPSCRGEPCVRPSSSSPFSCRFAFPPSPALFDKPRCPLLGLHVLWEQGQHFLPLEDGT